MARRRVKKRTHAGAKDEAQNGASNPKEQGPKSMVIRIGAGEVGSSVSQLVRDMRRVMEPDTAARLKERRANRLRDYTTMAGPLGISHLLLFGRSESGNTNMRLARTPRGPTLHFKVEKYSLCKDIARSMKNPKTGGYEFTRAPLLVMNNFISPPTEGEPSVPKHLEKLVTEMFQSLFPPISPQSTPLNSIRRVLLLNREPPKEGDNGTYTINLRHYLIETKLTGLPKSIRRLNAAEKLMTSKEKKKGLPNLGSLEDIADYMLDPSGAGYTSASESEVETDAEVEVLASTTRKVLTKRDKQRASAKETEEEGQADNRSSNPSLPRVEKRAIKLVELGPRMKLRLTKVEEDICGGRVMWHEFITKSKDEVKEMDEVWNKRKKEKAERKRIQRENVERKKKDKKERGKGPDGEEESESEEEDMADWDMDDDEWDGNPDDMEQDVDEDKAMEDEE